MSRARFDRFFRPSFLLTAATKLASFFTPVPFSLDIFDGAVFGAKPPEVLTR